MRKILTILPSLSMGGAEHMAYELIKNLDFLGYVSKVICYGPKRDTDLEKKMEAICDVVYMNITGSINPLHILKVMREISKFNPDVVHAHMGGVTFAIPWCNLHKKQLVLTIHTRPEKAFSYKNQKQIKSYIKSGRLTIVAVSEENYALVKEFYKIEDERVQFINNGIDINRFYRKSHDGFAFVNVARQDDNKNQAAIIRCFKRLYDQNPTIKLYLIGDGPCHNDLINMAAESNISKSVIIPGLCSNPEYYYALSDVYVQSSHREAMPLSVLEALATGLPIISTDVGGLKDVIKDNGFLVPDNDEELLFKKMEESTLLEIDRYEFMSRKSKEIVKRYSSVVMANEYSALYERNKKHEITKE